MKALSLFPTVRDSKISLHSEMVGTAWRPSQPVKQRLWRLFPSVRSSYRLAKSARLPRVAETLHGYLPVGGFHNVFVREQLLSNALSYIKPAWFVAGHMPFSDAFEQLLCRKDFRMILIVRDPRDVIYSELKFFKRVEKLALHNYYDNLSDEEGLMSIIQGVAPGEGHPVQPGLRTLLQEYLPWLSRSFVLLTRFEDLVGPRGGGDLATQHREIVRIADHLHISLSSKEIKHIADNLFGGTHTFRKGVIGSWRETLQPEHCEAMKNQVGDILIDLQYESSKSW
jgi:sulfotransferase 6B1